MVLVLWAAFHRVKLRGAWIAAAIAVAASLASMAVPGDRGWHARYYATAAATGSHERSVEYRDPAFTRVDDRLDFTHGDHDFHLAFFNDHTRFNFMRPGEPDRRYLEFAVAWTGWWLAPEGAHEVYLHAPKGAAEIAVDAAPVLTSTAQSGDVTTRLTLSGGWHRVHVTFSSPYGAPREFSAGEIVDGQRRPFDATVIRTERIDRRQQLVARALRILKPAADVIALAWLASIAMLLVLRRAGELWQRGIAAPRAAFALVAAAGVVEALRFAWPWTYRFLNMGAGDDPMTYEGYARDIILNGIWMNGGQPLGHGEPFYYQAFYPYFLAATHVVFGEGMFGVLFLQRWFVVLTAILLTRIAMQLRGDRVWPVGLVVAGLFAWWKFAPIARDLLTEALYIPLLTAWALSMISLCRRPAARSAAIAGVLGGFAAITRSTAMLSWVMLWPAVGMQLRGAPRRARVLGTLIACTIAVFSLVGIRNALVSHKFAPTSTELGVTLLGGNPTPAGVVIDPSARKPLYDRLGLSGYTIEVIEYALTAPGPFVANMGRKAVFALGFYEPYAQGWGYSPVYIVVWIGALFGVWVAIRDAGAQRFAALIPLLIAITQYVAVVIVYPKGERLILPIHTMLLPYAAIAAYELYALARAL